MPLPKLGWMHGRHWVLYVYDRGELDHLKTTDPSEALMYNVVILGAYLSSFPVTCDSGKSISSTKRGVILVGRILWRAFPA